MEKSETQLPYDKQKWDKNIDGYLQQINRLKNNMFHLCQTTQGIV